MRRSYSPAAHSKILLKSGYTPPSGGGAVYILDAWMTHGIGYLAGEFPDGITRVEGVPAPAMIRVHCRSSSGLIEDGVMVAEVSSAADGTWLVAGLNHNLKYDVICRHEGYNDMILSNVTPVVD